MRGIDRGVFQKEDALNSSCKSIFDCRFLPTSSKHIRRIRGQPRRHEVQVHSSISGSHAIPYHLFQRIKSLKTFLGQIFRALNRSRVFRGHSTRRQLLCLPEGDVRRAGDCGGSGGESRYCFVTKVRLQILNTCPAPAQKTALVISPRLPTPEESRSDSRKGKNCTAKVLERYCKYTSKVRRKYCKYTSKILQIVKP